MQKSCTQKTLTSNLVIAPAANELQKNETMFMIYPNLAKDLLHTNKWKGKLFTKDELELLKDYSHFIMQQVNELRLHPDHKEDLKEVLLQAMMQITINLQKANAPPKPQGFLFRLLNKTTR